MKAPCILTLVAFLGTAARAEAGTTRTRIPISSLPRQDEPIAIDVKSAILPGGLRDGSPVPKNWRLDAGQSMEFGNCTDDRRASIATSGSTEKIWESNGKVFFDRARLTIEEGKIHVTSAERVPVVYVGEDVWAYRKADAIRIVVARDASVFMRTILWGCSLDEVAVSAPSGTATFESSPERIDDVIRQVTELGIGGRPKNPPWKGATFNALASVSKASADTEPMLNLVIRRP
jgi:hypothetical protein